jgi:SAM-dependent methyltransferase
MVKNYFNYDYTRYWQKSVKKSIDGTIIAGPSEVDFILKKLNLNNFYNILDLGCSYGRMFNSLNKIGNKIYGCDIDEFAIKEANNFNYFDLKVCSSVELEYENNFFDLVFCWAVFDVLDQGNTLKCVNKIIKKDGFFLITAKNANYSNHDELAFIAEKNAALKKFPNKFIDLKKFLKSLFQYGFVTKNLYLFPKRGDMGQLKFIEINDLDKFNDESYEFLILLQKINGVNEEKKIKFSSNYSKTATNIACSNGIKDTLQFFKKNP